jgi:hypothetical protein
MLQGVSYLMAKLEPSRKDQWSRTIRDSMATWLRGQDNITFTPKVRSKKDAGSAVVCCAYWAC